MFKRKVYEQLLEWKKEWDGKYACLLEGARRVDKTTIAEEYRICINLFLASLQQRIKYSKQVGERFLLSQKDVGEIGTLKLKPIYMILFLLKDL